MVKFLSFPFLKNEFGMQDLILPRFLLDVAKTIFSLGDRQTLGVSLDLCFPVYNNINQCKLCFWS